MKKIFTISLLLFISIFSFGRTLTGSGQANTLEEAKKEALRDISTQIEVKVVSEFSKEETIKNNENYEGTKTSKINISSMNDILGVDFIVNKINGEFVVEAYLDDSSLPLYEYQIDEISNKITLNVKNADSTEDLVFKKNYLNEALNNFNKWETYKSVAAVLGSTKKYQTTYTKAYVENEIEKINRVLEQKKVVFVEFDELFDNSSSNKYLRTEINKLLNSISKKYEDSLRITRNPAKKNVTFKVNVDSFYVETVPPVFYNKKQISNEFYKGDVSLTFVIFNELTKNRLASFSVSGSAKSFTNENNAIDRAIRKVLIDQNTKKKIEKSLVDKK